MKILKAGILYFAIVFGAGFVFGTIRTIWVVPRIGTRWAELLEMPLMFAVTIAAARWLVLRLAIPSTSSARLEMEGLRSCCWSRQSLGQCVGFAGSRSGGTLKHETLFQKLFITSCLACLRSCRSWSRDDKLSSVRIAAC